jgi:hypothetical protein
MNGERRARLATTQTPKAPMTARSPWARLIMRITPNISDSPQANRAYKPPRKMPWMMALVQLMFAARGRAPPLRARC